MREKIVEAIQFIKENEPPEGYFVAFSGGKDSIVVANLVAMAGVKHQLWYSCTRIDPPEVVKFIKEHYPQCRFAYPKLTFWHGIMTKNPPTFRCRWCCDYLKKQPTKKIPLPHRVLGIRREESNKRRSYPRIKVWERPHQIHYYPILLWNESDVWEFIESQQLAYPSLYDEGFDRLGCIVCPFRNARAHAYWRARWPQVYHTFEAVMRKWWYKRQAQGKPMLHSNPDEYIQAWYAKQFKMFSDKLLIK